MTGRQLVLAPAQASNCAHLLARAPSRPSLRLQAERFTLAVKSFQLDQFLAPYDLSSHNRWRQLSVHIRWVLAPPAVHAALRPLPGWACS